MSFTMFVTWFSWEWWQACWRTGHESAEGYGLKKESSSVSSGHRIELDLRAVGLFSGRPESSAMAFVAASARSFRSCSTQVLADRECWREKGR